MLLRHHRRQTRTPSQTSLRSTPGSVPWDPHHLRKPDRPGGDRANAGVTDGTSVTHKRTTTFTIGTTADDFGNYGELDITVGIAVTGVDSRTGTADGAHQAAERRLPLCRVATWRLGERQSRDPQGHATESATTDHSFLVWTG